MRENPYRRNEPRDDDAEENESLAISAVFEERILQIVFLLIGGAGVALGMSDPRVHPSELSIGAILVLVGLYPLLRRRKG